MTLPPKNTAHDTYVSTTSLRPYANNAKNRPKAQIEKMAASMPEFSFLNLIDIGSEDILDGPHSCRVIAELLGPEKAPALQATHLKPVNEMAYPFPENANWKGGKHGFKR